MISEANRINIRTSACVVASPVSVDKGLSFIQHPFHCFILKHIDSVWLETKAKKNMAIPVSDIYEIKFTHSIADELRVLTSS